MYKFETVSMIALEKIAAYEAREAYASDEVEIAIDAMFDCGSSLVAELRMAGKAEEKSMEAEWLIEKLQMAEIAFSAWRSDQPCEDIPF